MLKKSLIAAIGATTLIATNAAFAAGPAHPANNETGTVYHGAEYGRVNGRLARVDQLRAQGGKAAPSSANDDWEYVGGETGWQLKQHRFDFVNGRLVHSDKIPHDTPKPKFIAEPSNSPNGHVGSGA